MVVMRSQAQTLINQFSKLSTNQKVHMDAPVLNYVLSPFEGEINHVDPQEIKFYLQSTKEIYKSSDLHVLKLFYHYI